MVGIGIRTCSNGLALLLVGAPLWVFVWQRIQASLFEPAESSSLTRLVVLYLLAFIGVGAVLGSGGVALYVLLRFVLGESMGLAGMLGRSACTLRSAGFGGVWALRALAKRRDQATPTLWKRKIKPNRRAAALRRLYYYVLSLLGLGTTFMDLRCCLHSPGPG
jgi:hypothetical protein